MKTLRACLAAGWFVCAVVASARADDNLRHYQESLRDQGFYYGPVDGSAGDETTQAIRRYQIRNGLNVTGQLDDATRRAIDKSAADAREAAQSTPPPLVTPTPTPVPRATPPPTYRPPATPRPTAPHNDDDQDDDTRPTPGGSRQERPPGGVPPSAALSAFFQDSPYEFAPPPVQADVVRRVQTFLKRNGFYDGSEDGRPGPDLSEALSNFQEVNHIRRTGRLDPSTLAVLRMLPPRRYRQTRGENPDEYRNGGASIYEGRIVH